MVAAALPDPECLLSTMHAPNVGPDRTPMFKAVRWTYQHCLLSLHNDANLYCACLADMQESKLPWGPSLLL